MIIFTRNGITSDGVDYTLDDIKRGVFKRQIDVYDLVILKMEWLGGRGFDGIHESVIMTRENADKFVTSFIDGGGTDVNFGEIAGKHSVVSGTLERDDITIVTDKKDILAFMVAYGYSNSGEHTFTWALHEFLEYDANSDDYMTPTEFEKLFEIN